MKFSQFLLIKSVLAAFALNAQTMNHSHLPIAAPAQALPVSLSLALTKDAVSGYNLRLTTKNYTLMPPPGGASMSALMTASMDQQTKILAGHGHLYVNGNKIQRIYGRNLHLPANLFKGGTNSISVSLNNHGHMYWTLDDKKVVSTLYINHQEEDFLTYKFESFPVTRD